MNGDAVHSELLRLLARRGELTEALEQTDLAIARYRGMFDLARAVNAAPPAVGSIDAAGEESIAPTTPTPKARLGSKGAPEDGHDSPFGDLPASIRKKPARARGGE